MDLPALSRISAGELHRRLAEGEAITVADVRGRIVYDRLHIAGAISLFLREVEDRSAELSPTGEIVLY